MLYKNKMTKILFSVSNFLFKQGSKHRELKQKVNLPWDFKRDMFLPNPKYKHIKSIASP
jgi:hypothetical protein